jgi:hypothetical protein
MSHPPRPGWTLGPSFSLSMPAAKFSPGRVLCTPAALSLLETHQCSPLSLLARHLSGDWGTVCEEDAALNDEALCSGLRILSAYEIAPDATLWILTEADRAVTTLLLPDEY